jgi:hypothetical protein
MGLFSSGSGNAQRRAARKARAQKDAVGKKEKKSEKQTEKGIAERKAAEVTARKDLESGRSSAVSAVKSYSDKGRSDLEWARTRGTEQLYGARDLGVGDLRRGESVGRGDISSGLERQRGLYGEARGLYEPLLAAASQARGLYGDFHGLGGAEGSARATQAWEGSPLYGAMTDYNKLGMQGIDRAAAARGNPYNFTDQAEFLQDSASKHLGEFTGGIWNMAGQEDEFANALAGLYGAEAQAEAQAAAQMAGITTDTASRIAALEGQTGQSVAGLTANTGSQLNDNALATGAQLGEINTGTAGRLAQTSYNTGAGVAGDWQNQAGRTYQSGGKIADIRGDQYDAQQAANNASQQNMWNAINLAAKPITAYAGNPSAFA